MLVGIQHKVFASHFLGRETKNEEDRVRICSPSAPKLEIFKSCSAVYDFCFFAADVLCKFRSQKFETPHFSDSKDSEMIGVCKEHTFERGKKHCIKGDCNVI